MTTRFLVCAVLCNLLMFGGTTGQCASFDERLWEKYADIDMLSVSKIANLAAIYLEPDQLGNINTKLPFADFRIITDRKEEVPWQIISRKPEKQSRELKSKMQNASRTEKGETWIELSIESEQPHINVLEIITPDTDFSRQVQVLGSSDGKNWNIVRKDGVIFDINRGEKLRQTYITFPEITFRHVAIKIINGDAQPLNITNVRVLQEIYSLGQTYTIYGAIGKSDIDTTNKVNTIHVGMSSAFPLDRLVFSTGDRNFQRAVEVQVKRDNGTWEHWASGTIFNFDTITMHESKMVVDIPEIAAREFRIIFKNLDSPPLSINAIYGEGYRRLLVFKQQPERKLYLFWGNPLAKQPQYDLTELVLKQKPDQIPLAQLAKPRSNTKFAGNSARLPFTERYKYPLYIVVILVIAGLILMQYRVFKHMKDHTHD